MRMLTTRRPYFHPRCTSAALLLLELAGLSSRLGRGATLYYLPQSSRVIRGEHITPQPFLAIFAADTTSAIRIIYQRITSVHPPPSGEAIRPHSDLLFSYTVHGPRKGERLPRISGGGSIRKKGLLILLL